eukprot:g6726.t1
MKIWSRPRWCFPLHVVPREIPAVTEDCVCRICQENSGDLLGVFCDCKGVWAWLLASRHCENPAQMSLSSVFTSCTSDVTLSGYMRSTLGSAGIGLLVHGITCGWPIS